jgi:hypothetical protein
MQPELLQVRQNWVQLLVVLVGRRGCPPLLVIVEVLIGMLAIEEATIILVKLLISFWEQVVWGWHWLDTPPVTVVVGTVVLLWETVKMKRELKLVELIPASI